MTAKNRKRAVIYVRISRDDKVEDGYSDRAHDRQLEACEALTKARGWDVTAIVREKHSAYMDEDDRPEWARVLDMMRAGEVDVVVAWKLDRITRQVKGLIDLMQVAKDSQVAVATTDGQLDLTTKTGAAVATILVTIAQLEVEVKAERQMAANLQAAKRGDPWKAGWRPLGYTDDKLQIDEDEAQYIRKAAEDVLDGKALRQVAREWREAELTTPRSKKGPSGWTHQGVKSVLLNPRNAGYSTYKGEIVGRGLWPAILSDDTYHQLVALLGDPARRTNHQSSGPGRSPGHLLTKIARCGICGETVYSRRRGGKQRYTCPTEHLATYMEEADEFVLSAMRFESLIADKASELHTSPVVDTNDMRAKLDALTRRELKIAESWGSGDLTDAVFEAANKSARDERSRLLEEISNLERQADDRHTLNSAKRWDDMPLIQARGYLERLTEITLYPKYHRKNITIDEQVVMFVRKVAPDGSEVWMPSVGVHPDLTEAMEQGRTIWGNTPVDPGLWRVLDENDAREAENARPLP